MTHQIRAIPTSYAGCSFRSRLEARWAVFFDTLNIPWEYEPQGYVLSDGDWYLPDFWLPSLETWFEVKGPPPTENEKQRARLLAFGLDQRVVIFWGSFQARTTHKLEATNNGLAMWPDFVRDQGRSPDTWFGAVAWLECSGCRCILIDGFGRLVGCPHCGDSVHNLWVRDLLGRKTRGRNLARQLAHAQSMARATRFHR